MSEAIEVIEYQETLKKNKITLKDKFINFFKIKKWWTVSSSYNQPKSDDRLSQVTLEIMRLEQQCSFKGGKLQEEENMPLEQEMVETHIHLVRSDISGLQGGDIT